MTSQWPFPPPSLPPFPSRPPLTYPNMRGACGETGHLVDELHVASQPLQGLLADAGLPKEHGEVIRAGHQALWGVATRCLIPLQSSLQERECNDQSTDHSLKRRTVWHCCLLSDVPSGLPARKQMVVISQLVAAQDEEALCGIAACCSMCF